MIGKMILDVLTLISSCQVNTRGREASLCSLMIYVSLPYWTELRFYSLDSLETSSNQWNHIKTTFQHAAALIVLDICTWLIVDVFYVFEEQMITNSSIRTQKHS